MSCKKLSLKPFGVRTAIIFVTSLKLLVFARTVCVRCLITWHDGLWCSVLCKYRMGSREGAGVCVRNTLDEAALEHCFREMCLMRSSRILTEVIALIG